MNPRPLLGKAFETKNLSELQELFEESKDVPATDTFFWLYLSKHPEIFFQIYEEEKQRQDGVDSDDKLHVLSSPIPLLPVREENLSLVPSITRGNWRQFGYDWFKSCSTLEAREYMEELLEGAMSVIDQLDTIPGVAICGGFPAKLIYQKWNQLVVAKPGAQRVDGKGPFVTRATDEFDIDIFLVEVGHKPVAKILKEVMDVFRGATWVDTPNALFCEYHNFKFQIIKRCYSSVNEVLLGFDLDSCAAAYTCGKFLVHQRFIRAVTHGANVILPMRQSASYDFRLNKYLHRGFTIWVPADLHLDEKQWKIIKKMKQLLKLHEKKYKSKQVSDYTPDYIEDLLRIPRAKENFLDKFPDTKLVHTIEDVDFATWRVRDPGSQITGTFNPTMKDYLSSLHE